MQRSQVIHTNLRPQIARITSILQLSSLLRSATRTCISQLIQWRPSSQFQRRKITQNLTARRLSKLRLRAYPRNPRVESASQKQLKQGRETAQRQVRRALTKRRRYIELHSQSRGLLQNQIWPLWIRSTSPTKKMSSAPPTFNKNSIKYSMH